MTLGTWFNPNSQKLSFQNEDGNYQIISDFSTLTFDGSKPQYKLLSELIGKNTAVLTEEFLVQQLKSKIPRITITDWWTINYFNTSIQIVPFYPS